MAGRKPFNKCLNLFVIGSSVYVMKNIITASNIKNNDYTLIGPDTSYTVILLNGVYITYF